MAAVALVAAGCSNSVPSNASFAAKADAICASFNAAGAGLSSSGGVAAVKSEQALLAAALTKLETVSPPFNLGAQFTSFLEEFVQVQPLLPQLADATAAHDTARISALNRQVRTFERNAKVSAVEAGLKSCP